MPNALTVLRLVLVPVFGWLLLRDGGRDDSRRCWRRAGLRGGHRHRLARRRDRPPPRPGHRLRQDRRPDRRQGAHRRRAGRPVHARRAAVVGHRRDPGPRDRRDRCCASGSSGTASSPASRGGKVKTVLQALAIGLYLLPLHRRAASLAGGDGRRGRADRGDRPGLRLPRAHPAPDQRARHAGRRGAAGRGPEPAPATLAPTPPPE